MNGRNNEDPKQEPLHKNVNPTWRFSSNSLLKTKTVSTSPVKINRVDFWDLYCIICSKPSHNFYLTEFMSHELVVPLLIGVKRMKEGI